VWIEKNRQLEKELDWAKEMADRLDRHNQALTRENVRLKAQFKANEDDREYLIRQLVASKKDNARLRQDITRVKADLDSANGALSAAHLPMVQTSVRDVESPGAAAASSPSRPNTSSSSRGGGGVSRGMDGGDVDDPRTREVIKRLKKLLEVERRNLRQVRASYAAQLKERTELEVFLRQCVDDVKSDIARRKGAVQGGGGGAGHLPPVGGVSGHRSVDRRASGQGLGDASLSQFSADDRARVMELLLAQERVIGLLYDRTFPSTSASSRAEGGEGVGGGADGLDPAVFGSNVDLHAGLEDVEGDDGEGNSTVKRLVALRNSGAMSAASAPMHLGPSRPSSSRRR
jgi:hypothetical protein